MNEPSFVDFETVIRLHRLAIVEFGGLDGIRDEDGLRGALGRPRTCYAYECNPEEDSEGRVLALIAASYWVSIDNAQSFVKGNKRTALACFNEFLASNGLQVNFSYEEIVDIKERVATKRLGRDDLATLIEPKLSAYQVDK